MSRSINGSLRGRAARGTDDIDTPPMPEYLRKCLEIQAYLGEPLYCEWCEAGPDNNADFEQYVADEYAKLFPAIETWPSPNPCHVCGGTRTLDVALGSGAKVDQVA